MIHPCLCLVVFDLDSHAIAAQAPIIVSHSSPLKLPLSLLLKLLYFRDQHRVPLLLFNFIHYTCSAMGVIRRRRRRRFHHHHHRRRHCGMSFAAVTALAFLLFASAASAVILNPTRQLGGGVVDEVEEARRSSGREVLEWEPVVVTRRRLGGLGSSPPTCRSKCGRCAPCKPVHVPIHPGLIMPLEYYPEAWRCKCGNKLFMP